MIAYPPTLTISRMLPLSILIWLLLTKKDSKTRLNHSTFILKPSNEKQSRSHSFICNNRNTLLKLDKLGRWPIAEKSIWVITRGKSLANHLKLQHRQITLLLMLINWCRLLTILAVSSTHPTSLQEVPILLLYLLLTTLRLQASIVVSHNEVLKISEWICAELIKNEHQFNSLSKI